jgi:hypothetical protein
MSITIRDFDKLQGIEDRQCWTSHAPNGTKTEGGKRNLTDVDFSTLRHVALDIIDNELYTSKELENHFTHIIESEVDLINRIDDIDEIAYLIFLKLKKQEVDKTLVLMREIYSGIPTNWENKLLVRLSAEVEMKHSLKLERHAANALNVKLPEKTMNGVTPNFKTIREHPLIINECPSLKPYLL